MLIFLDYRVRTRKEEPGFFARGRVFAMLWFEPTDQTLSSRTDETTHTPHPDLSNTTGGLDKKFSCSIRKFVIMRVNRPNHFFEAW
jgi:hypothetical protein